MEEDVKILQEMIKLNKKRIEPQIINAIENLINKNKELEKAMAMISEICVDESKCHITSREAVEEIRKNIFWKAKGE